MSKNPSHLRPVGGGNLSGKSSAAADQGNAIPGKGRGALSQPKVRYFRTHTEPFDDGWQTLDEPAPKLRTEVLPDKARSIITYNKSPDVMFGRSINPYRGCEHGCVYCFARPTHANLGLSPGLDFESKLFAKFDAAKLLDKELRKPSYTPDVLALGVNTDCYQPVERSLKITRSVLEVLERFGHPVSIVTKSAMITRDLDILQQLAERTLVEVAISLTTLNRQLVRRMEPRAATPFRRLEVIETLSKAGIPVSVMMAPVIPGLTDHEMEKLLKMARDAGARRAGYVLLRMPFEIKGLMKEWLETHYPDRARRVVGLMRDMHGGKDYVSQFGLRQRGTGPFAELLQRRFNAACQRLGLNERRYDLSRKQFRVPLEAVAAAEDKQLKLL